MKRIIPLLLALLLTLTMVGCQEEAPETPTEPQPSESLVWETMPQLAYGVMEYEKLEVLPWYSGRCEATSYDTLAETDLGYYLLDPSDDLQYADKTDLANWLPVCNNPSCSHTDANMRCSSHLALQNFVIRDGTIYYGQYNGDPEFYAGNASYIWSIAWPNNNKGGTFHEKNHFIGTVA